MVGEYERFRSHSGRHSTRMEASSDVSPPLVSGGFRSITNKNCFQFASPFLLALLQLRPAPDVLIPRGRIELERQKALYRKMSRAIFPRRTPPRFKISSLRVASKIRTSLLANRGLLLLPLTILTIDFDRLVDFRRETKPGRENGRFHNGKWGTLSHF
jgi:hypothetical protein